MAMMKVHPVPKPAILDALPWGDYTRVVLRLDNGTIVDIRRSGDVYMIYHEQSFNGALIGSWRYVDALMAQCVLFHLTETEAAPCTP